MRRSCKGTVEGTSARRTRSVMHCMHLPAPPSNRQWLSSNLRVEDQLREGKNTQGASADCIQQSASTPYIARKNVSMRGYECHVTSKDGGAMDDCARWSRPAEGFDESCVQSIYMHLHIPLLARNMETLARERAGRVTVTERLLAFL